MIIMTENNIKYTKNDISKQFNEIKNEIDFLISENFKLYLQTRNIKSLSNYEKNYNIFKFNYKEHIKNNGGYIYTAYQNNDIIGILYINKNYYIDSLFIKQQYQNQQIGSNLLNRCLNDYINNEITLTCTKNVLKFYKKIGFTKTKVNNSNSETYQLIYKKQ